MLGWHITVCRQIDGGNSPATFATKEGAHVAVWQADLGGLWWLDDLVERGMAIALGGNGYPLRYTARAQYLVPVIVDGPPRARETWLSDPGDILTSQWAGKTVIDNAAAAACRPDEWLLVEVWDES